MTAPSAKSCPRPFIPIQPIEAEEAHSVAQCRLCANQAARLDFIVTLCEAFFSVMMGALTGSAGLHALGLLMIGDILSKGINWMAIRFSHKPPTRQFPYGYGKIQFLSALLIGFLLIIGGVLFFVHNIQDIQDGQMQRTGIVAIFSSLLLAASSWMMYRIMSCTADHNNNPAIRAAALDNRVDAWSSIMVLVGALLTHFDFLTADRIMALLVSLLVVKFGSSIVTEAVHGLLDMGLPYDIQSQVQHVCCSSQKISGLKSLRGRRMGSSYEIDIELFVSGECSFCESDTIRNEILFSVKNKIKYAGDVQIILLPESSMRYNQTQACRTSS
ncbi:MAG: cation transporter [Magnetococcales bacterium]|nr:cation transporter [Magnetococcales bacterium]